MHTFVEALRNSVLITGLVMIMMILIEFVNIHSHGESFRKLKDSKIKQVFVAALLGLIPGCVGGFAVVSLYAHRLLSFGALVTMMIVSSGDEAFVMLAMIPKTAIILFAILFILGIIVGLITDKFVKRPIATLPQNHYETLTNCCDTHPEAPKSIFNSTIKENFKKVTRERALIVIGIALFIAAVVMGLLEHDHSAHAHTHHHHAAHIEENTHNINSILFVDEEKRVCIQEELFEEPHAHDHEVGETHTHLHSDEDGHNHAHIETNFNIFSERWINLLFAGLSLIVLIMTAKANNHFIKEHLWNHVIKKHLKSIFLWTFGALLIIHFGIQFLNLEELIAKNIYLVILAAALIGLIPESGPHMLFITLFASGMAPFSVLLTSSIVQDGHTALPLLAESKKSFAYAKLINLFVGLVVGYLTYFAGL